MTRDASLIGRVASLFLVVLLLIAGALGPAFAQDDAPSDQGMDRLIADGRLVYEANCQACHKADGSGAPGTFPPLLDNPNVDDTDYLRDVIRSGLQGEIEALGETYNGNMPPFSLLDEGQVTSLVAYVQEGLGVSLPPPPADTDTTGSADTGSSSSARLIYLTLTVIVLVAVGIFVRPKVLARSDGGSFSSTQGWVKSILIVLYFIIATVFIPSQVVESSALASPPSVFGDSISADLWDTIRSLIGTGVWTVAFGIGVWGLRRMQRTRVI